MKEDPDERPTIEEIQGLLLDTMKNARLALPRTIDLDGTPLLQLEDTIKKGLLGLADSLLLTERGIWFDGPNLHEGSGTPKIIKVASPGLSVGLAGVLYLVAEARFSGFEVGHLSGITQRVWPHISTYLENTSGQLGTGLFKGLAGITLAMTKSINAGLIQPGTAYENAMHRLKRINPTQLGIADGVAGQD
ncbi:hypothetical protein ACQ86N_02645 [Puia sp. P3]|uniref:hypothetical protein n=1 Tax=Puia sp. P3 TaxID=3423952 RepID=UPI003D66D372